MDISSLRVEFFRGYESEFPLPDGYIQKDKYLPYFSVVYPLQGYYILQIEDKEPITVPPDGCFLVPSGVRHTLIHKSDTGCLMDRWLFFSVWSDELGDITSLLSPPAVLTGEAAVPFCRAVDDALKDGQEHERSFRALRISGQLLEQILSISEFSLPQELFRIAPARRLMQSSVSRRLTVADMARECGMSESHFFRVFRRLTGKSPMEEFTEYRLQQAARLLWQTGYTLAAIAAECGFCDEFHLSRTFKRHYGSAPREYRSLKPK